jgi:hypothetical protein
VIGDQFLARAEQGRDVQRQEPADCPVAVVAQALAISHGDQEQVEGQGIGRAAAGVPVTDQAMVDPTELVRDLP